MCEWLVILLILIFSGKNLNYFCAAYNICDHLKFDFLQFWNPSVTPLGPSRLSLRDLGGPEIRCTNQEIKNKIHLWTSILCPKSHDPFHIVTYFISNGPRLLGHTVCTSICPKNGRNILGVGKPLSCLQLYTQYTTNNTNNVIIIILKKTKIV